MLLPLLLLLLLLLEGGIDCTTGLEDARAGWRWDIRGGLLEGELAAAAAAGVMSLIQRLLGEKIPKVHIELGSASSSIIILLLRVRSRLILLLPLLLLRRTIISP